MTITITSNHNRYKDLIAKYGNNIPVVSMIPSRLLQGEPAYIVDKGNKTYTEWELVSEKDTQGEK